MPTVIHGPRVLSTKTYAVQLPKTTGKWELRKEVAKNEVQVSPAAPSRPSLEGEVRVDIVGGSDAPSGFSGEVQDIGPSMIKFLGEEQGQVHQGLHFSRVGFCVRPASWLPAFLQVGSGREGAKQILSEVAGEVLRGESLALLGPSGAGKTTLLRVLTNKTPGYGKPSGNVDLDQLPLSPDVLRKCCAFVEQEDSSLPNLLTTREALGYAADFWLESSKDRRLERVTEVLSSMKLDACADVRCGNLSGGQRRRVSVALALLKDPAVLFMDEPTSGLDSSAARDVIGCVKHIAATTGMVVVCTIHQPSTELFASFSRAMILGKNGKVAYCGPTASLPGFLSDVEHPLPEGSNLAEFALDLVDCDPAEEESTLRHVTAQWPSHRRPAHRTKEGFSPGVGGVLRGTSFRTSDGTVLGASLPAQLLVHLRRQSILAFRDPSLFSVRLVIFLLSNFLFTLVYFDSRTRNQDQVTNKVFLSVWFIAVPTCMSVAAIPAMAFQFRAIRKEVENGQYSPVSFLLASVVVQAIGVMLMALSALIMLYVFANFHTPAIPEMALLFAATIWTFGSIAQTLAVGLSSLEIGPQLAMLAQLALWFASFLFSGFFLRGGAPIIRDVFEKASPLRWAISSIIKAELRGTTWEGATLLLDTDGPDLQARAMGRGFYCPLDASPSLCFGRTGAQILDTLKAGLFETAGSEDTFRSDVLNIAAIGLAFKIATVLLVLGMTLSERFRSRTV